MLLPVRRPMASRKLTLRLQKDTSVLPTPMSGCSSSVAASIDRNPGNIGPQHQLAEGCSEGEFGMRRLALTTFCSVLAVGLAACGDADENSAAANAATNGSGMEAAAGDNAAAGGSGSATASGSAWPQGSRIVEENGVTYRVDSAGARVQLGPSDSRIVVTDGVRYRVDPDGARVRIDTRGDAIRIGDSTITGNAPNGRSDVETPGEAATDAVEDTAEAIGDAVPD